MTTHQPNKITPEDSATYSNSVDRDKNPPTEHELLHWPLRRLLEWTLLLYDATEELDNRFGSACEVLRVLEQSLTAHKILYRMPDLHFQFSHYHAHRPSTPPFPSKQAAKLDGSCGKHRGLHHCA